jgi:uncharacterized protein YvpB
MIAVERPAPELEPAEAKRAPQPAAGRLRLVLSPRIWPKSKPFGDKLTAAALMVALLAAIAGTAGVLNGFIAVGLQAKAAAVHQRWAVMRAEGIPDSDLAVLEQEWIYTQRIKYFGAGTDFWWPGASATVDSWQSATAAIWARDLRMNREGAIAADRTLHAALGAEPRTQTKARIDALGAAATPGDFAALRADWELEARLVPIDRNLASAAGTLATQVQQAAALGIRSDPAPESLARADGYSQMGALERMARAEMLTRNLANVRKDLQERLDAAGVTREAFGHVAHEINVAIIYGIDLSSYQARIDTNHGAYANAATAAEFNGITSDLNGIATIADNAVNTALNTTHVISGVAFIFQNHPLSCEEAATSMALTHQGINVSQDQILAELGADRRPVYVDASGRVRWGNPYETFVGNVDGSESNFSGYGTYWPPLVRIAKAHGARLIAYGAMSADTIYARVIAGHPVVAFATWDWAWHPRHDYLSFDGQWIPFIGPAQASHVYTVVGVSPSSVLINDPIRGQYWISKGAFQAGYSDFGEAIVFA